ncbi:MAG UNVERIFIED_CONTAM: helix-turn-helix domain-containing protein [Rickettsiaceae bacterium]|jgi:cytoskeletal protein RodZ
MISKLKQSRISLNLTVQEVSDALKIRKQYIIALEEERFEELPGATYANGYMKKYCDFLAIPHLESVLAY